MLAVLPRPHIRLFPSDLRCGTGRRSQARRRLRGSIKRREAALREESGSARSELVLRPAPGKANLLYPWGLAWPPRKVQLGCRGLELSPRRKKGGKRYSLRALAPSLIMPLPSLFAQSWMLFAHSVRQELVPLGPDSVSGTTAFRSEKGRRRLHVSVTH